MEFTLTSGTLRVSDPCYDRALDAAGIIENARNGRWIGKIDIINAMAWGNRVAELSIVQENYVTASKMWERAPFDVGVDSGQAGFFDDSNYPEWSEDNGFYDIICEGTISKDKFAVVPFGIASRTGYGDGLYQCFVAKNVEGEVIAAKIVFIGDDEIESELDEDYEDDYPLEEEF